MLPLLALSLASVALNAPTPVAGHLRIAIDTRAAQADYRATPRRTGVVVLHAWETRRLRRLKVANPRIRVLMYKDLSFMAAQDREGRLSTGVSTGEAARQPSFYLRARGGRRFTSASYAFLYAADVGDPAYQRRWTHNVLQALEQAPWDGVLVDDANPTIRHHYRVDRVRRYPTDASYGAATGRALGVIGPRLRAAGKLVIANVGDWRLHRPEVRRWLDDVSGAMEEQFTKFGGSGRGTGYLPEQDWLAERAAQADAERKGKWFLGVAHSDRRDRAAARYGWASILLGAQGRSFFSLAADYTTESWFPEFGSRLGAPTGPSRAGPDGIHRRRFADGLVVVNPTSRAARVTLGGRYDGSGLVGASQATLRPHTGLVLVRARPRLAGRRFP